jgi:tetratricopeptide (TPR) repeat protein
MPKTILLGIAGGLLLYAGAYAADTASVLPGEPDLTSARANIAAKHYDKALAELKTLVRIFPQPNVYSLLGFALRKTGDRAQSMINYEKALEADPDHKGALEYQGELFAELGQIPEAKRNLARLNRLCVSGCEEASELKEAIEHALAPK